MGAIWCEQLELKSSVTLGGSPLSPAGNAAEMLPEGEPFKCRVEYVRRAVDDFGCTIMFLSYTRTSCL